MQNVNINTSNINGLAPLYKKYPGQFEPQPAHLEISPESNTAMFDYSGEIGSAIPMTVYHGRELRVDVSPCADSHDLKRLASDDDFIALLNRVVAGYSCDWDGNNHVGSLDDDASAAMDVLEQMLSRVDEVEVWDADEWLNGTLYDEDNTPMSKQQIAELTDERIGSLAELLASEAEGEGQVVYDLTDAIERMRDDAKADLGD